MANDFVSQQLAAIAAKKAAAVIATAQVAQLAPAAEPQTIVPSVTPGAPAKPAEMSRADWDALPPDVQALVALGPSGQATPVNPPEAAQGLVESATGRLAEDAPRRGRGRPPKSDGDPVIASAAPLTPVSSIDLAPLLVGLDAQGIGVRAELRAIRDAIESNTAATNALVEAVLGAASILAS